MNALERVGQRGDGSAGNNQSTGNPPRLIAGGFRCESPLSCALLILNSGLKKSGVRAESVNALTHAGRMSSAELFRTLPTAALTLCHCNRASGIGRHSALRSAVAAVRLSLLGIRHRIPCNLVAFTDAITGHPFYPFPFDDLLVSERPVDRHQPEPGWSI
jgi:hypothetical protein